MSALTSLRRIPMRLCALWLTAAVILGAAGSARALQVAPLWNLAAGDAASQFCYDVTIDDVTGRVAITGAFSGTMNPGGGNMTSAGANDGFIAVYGPDGAFIAQRQFGDASNQYGFALDWSSDGYLYVTGYFAGSVNMGGSSLASAGSNDIFLARYDYLLTHSVSKKFGDASAQYAFDLAVDESKNVVITGYFAGGVDFGGGLLTSAGNNDVYVARFNSVLTPTWSNRFGDAAGSQYGQGVDTDAAGNMYICGYFTGLVNFGGNNLTSAGSNDMFVAKFNSAGVHQWSKHFGDASNHIASKISAGSAGEVYVVGHFTGTVNFGGSLLTSVGAEDVFLAKFTTSGGHLWSQRYGDASSQFGLSVDSDDSAVYIGGQAAGIVSFGGGNLSAAGGRDAFIARLTAAGVHVWSRLYGDTVDQYGFAVDLGVGRVGFCGYFNGQINFGPGVLTSAGSSDTFLFLAGANSIEPVTRSVTDVPNDQGRRVRVRFDRSGYDDAVCADPVIAYEAYVELTALPAASGPAASPEGGGILVYVGSIPAHGETRYTMLVPTFADSTIVDGDYNSFVYIRAARKTTVPVYQSPAGIGSSIDNLAPGMSDLRLDGALLHWNPADAPDVDYYAIYGGAGANFANATLANYTTGTEIDMTASPRAYYFVTATDFSGNESTPSMVKVLTRIEDTPSSHVLSISAYPNPFNPSTTLRYAVPVRGRVQIDVYDARGSRVARLLDDNRPAGAHALAWDGADANGRRVGSGVYFARITQGAGTRTYKLVLVK